jgi:chemotaxis protein CheD
MVEEVYSGPIVKVGIAEGRVVRAPARIRTTGLGSCVGFVLFDKVAGIAGLAHVLLPSAPKDVANPAKYADSAVPWLFAEILREGADPRNVQAKLAGGAQMFASAGKSDILRVGPRNAEAVVVALQSLGIPILAADVGGNVGRTIEFDPVTGDLYVKTALRGTYTI